MSDHRNNFKKRKEAYKEVGIVDQNKRHPSSSTAMTDGNLKKRRGGKKSNINNCKKMKYNPTSQGCHDGSCAQVFVGMVLAVSNFNSSAEKEEGREKMLEDGPEDDTQHYSYKIMVQQLKAAGATVSSQVHKRVHALITSSLKNYNNDENDRSIVTTVSTTVLTQRVRKALKLNVSIVDFSWVRDSLKEGRKLDMEPYLLNSKAAAIIADNTTTISDKGDVKKMKRRKIPSVKEKFVEICNNNVSLGCCCACHDSEDAVYDCPWCVSCR